MILSKEQYEQMIEDDPFPWYKYSRLSEEEKTLSYLTMNGCEHENLTVAIAKFGPQPFRGTYGTNFQPPGFERNVCQYNVFANNFRPGPDPPPGLLPPGIHHYGSYVPDFLYPPGVNLHDCSLPGPSLSGIPGPNPIQSIDHPLLYNALTQSSKPVSHEQRNSMIEPGNGKAPLIKSIPWKSPAFGPLVVGGDSSDDECDKASHVKNLSRKPPAYGPVAVGLNSDDECDVTVNLGCEETSLLKRRTRTAPASDPLVVGCDSSEDDDLDYKYYSGDETRRPKQSCLDRKRSTSSIVSNETVDITSGRVSLTSSRTTPPKASCG